MHAKVSFLVMLRDAVIVAAVAVLTVQGMRRWFGDRYLVPSDSMQPLLFGDPVDGDVVFVDKLASASDRRRGDLVVVEHPTQSGQQLVKRIAACGDDHDACYINLIRGDVWLGPDAQSLRLDVKDPIDARQQRVLWARLDAGDSPGQELSPFEMGAAVPLAKEQGGPEAEGWRLPAVVASIADARTMFRPRALLARRVRNTLDPLPASFLGIASPLDATYLDALGRRSVTGEGEAVTDGCMQVVVAEPATAEILATIEMPGEALTFHWQPRTGRVVMWRNGIDIAETSLPGAEAGSIEFGRLDDRAWFCLDGSRERLFVVPRKQRWRNDPKSGVPVGPRALLHLGVVGGAGDGLSFRSLRVFRDVFHFHQRLLSAPGRPPEWPKFVEPGHWFLLGDNAFDSRDSRQLGSVPISDFLGVPRCVLGPWPRRRWL